MAKTKLSEETRAAVKAAIAKYPEWYFIHIDQAYNIKYPEEGYEFGPKYHEALGAYNALNDLIESLEFRPEDEDWEVVLKNLRIDYARRADSYQVALNCYVKVKVAEHNAIATKLHKDRMSARKAGV